MQGIVAGERSRGKPRQRWEKDTTDTFGTMAAASRVASISQRHPGSDVLTRICSEKRRERYIPYTTMNYVTLCIVYPPGNVQYSQSWRHSQSGSARQVRKWRTQAWSARVKERRLNPYKEHLQTRYSWIWFIGTRHFGPSWGWSSHAAIFTQIPHNCLNSQVLIHRGKNNIAWASKWQLRGFQSTPDSPDWETHSWVTSSQYWQSDCWVTRSQYWQSDYWVTRSQYWQSDCWVTSSQYWQSHSWVTSSQYWQSDYWVTRSQYWQSDSWITRSQYWQSDCWITRSQYWQSDYWVTSSQYWQSDYWVTSSQYWQSDYWVTSSQYWQSDYWVTSSQYWQSDYVNNRIDRCLRLHVEE